MRDVMVVPEHSDDKAAQFESPFRSTPSIPTKLQLTVLRRKTAVINDAARD